METFLVLIFSPALFAALVPVFSGALTYFFAAPNKDRQDRLKSLTMRLKDASLYGGDSDKAYAQAFSEIMENLFIFDDLNDFLYTNKPKNRPVALLISVATSVAFIPLLVFDVSSKSEKTNALFNVFFGNFSEFSSLDFSDPFFALLIISLSTLLPIRILGRFKKIGPGTLTKQSQSFQTHRHEAFALARRFVHEKFAAGLLNQIKDHAKSGWRPADRRSD